VIQAQSTQKFKSCNISVYLPFFDPLLADCQRQAWKTPCPLPPLNGRNSTKHRPCPSQAVARRSSHLEPRCSYPVKLPSTLEHTSCRWAPARQRYLDGHTELQQSANSCRKRLRSSPSLRFENVSTEIALSGRWFGVRATAEPSACDSGYSQGNALVYCLERRRQTTKTAGNILLLHKGAHFVDNTGTNNHTEKMSQARHCWLHPQLAFPRVSPWLVPSSYKVRILRSRVDSRLRYWFLVKILTPTQRAPRGQGHCKGRHLQHPRTRSHSVRASAGHILTTVCLRSKSGFNTPPVSDVEDVHIPASQGIPRSPGKGSPLVAPTH